MDIFDRFRKTYINLYPSLGCSSYQNIIACTFLATAKETETEELSLEWFYPSTSAREMQGAGRLPPRKLPKLCHCDLQLRPRSLQTKELARQVEIGLILSFTANITKKGAFYNTLRSPSATSNTCQHTYWFTLNDLLHSGRIITRTYPSIQAQYQVPRPNLPMIGTV